MSLLPEVGKIIAFVLIYRVVESTEMGIGECSIESVRRIVVQIRSLLQVSYMRDEGKEKDSFSRVHEPERGI